MKRVSNKGCGALVAKRIPFQGSNLFATNVIDTDQLTVYVVYSYGHHFPMYIYDSDVDQWFANKDKYSSSTTRQQSHAYPHGVTAVHYLDTNDMRTLTYMGYRKFIQQRIGANHDQALKQAA